MKDTHITPTEPAVSADKAKSPAHRRNLSLLIACIAVFVAFCTVTSFLVADIVGANRPAETPNEDLPFNYSELDIKDYFADFSASEVTGLTIPGKEYSVAEVDEEYIKDYINYLFRASAKVEVSGNRSEPVDYADQLYIYILSAKYNGESVQDDYFINAYGQSNPLIIGDKTFGEEFDNALIGLIPADSYYTHKTSASVTDTSVITLSYNATIEGEEKAYKSVSNLRLDLATADSYLKTPLLAAAPVVGQQFEFTAVYDIDDDGEDETVKYEAFINSVLEETPFVFTATLPEDYFPETWEDEYTELNGKAIEFSVIIEYSNSYSAKKYEEITKADIEAMVKAQSLNFTVKKDSDDATTKAELFDFLMDAEKKSREESLKNNKINLIWNTILDEMTFAVPEEASVKAATSLRAQLQATYMEYAGTYGDSFLSDCPTLEDFARDYYFGYDAEEYASYEEYIDEYSAVRYARQQMLLYGIFEYCNLKIDEDAFQKEYKSTMESNQKYFGTSDKPATEKEVNRQFIAQYGADLETLLRSNYIYEAVNNYLTEKNEIDFTLASEPKDNK